MPLLSSVGNTNGDLLLPPCQVLSERGALHASWQAKKVYLDQLIDLQFFLRDAKALDAGSAAQEAALSSHDLPSSVEAVTAQVWMRAVRRAVKGQ